MVVDYKPVMERFILVHREQKDTGFKGMTVVRTTMRDGDRKMDVFTRDGMALQIKYFRIFDDVLQAIRDKQNPFVTQDLRRRGKTAEELIREGCDQYLAGIAKNKNTEALHEHPLFPLMEQSALERLFNQSSDTPVVTFCHN